MSNPTPIALTIAGSDSSGGAGIQADLKAFSANGVYGASVLTAITAQNTQGVSAVHAVPVDIVSAQIDAVLSDLNVSAIKIGMLFSPELVQAVADAIKGFTGHVVLDPVMIAKSGDPLLQQESIAAIKDIMLPRADLLTPNIPEAITLFGNTPTQADYENSKLSYYAKALLALGPKNVLLKGGHGSDATCLDVLVQEDQTLSEFSAPRIHTRNTHGTGCTYSSTIAAWLSHGVDMGLAVKQSHRYLNRAIQAADELDIGSGHGPVHHFYQLWKI